MKIKLLDPECKPYKKHYSDAGIDLKSANESFIILKDETATINTGIKMEIPIGYCAMIFPRSGLGSKGLVLRNTVGIIDSDYRGEVMLKVKNTGDEPIVINQYDRIAQMLIIPITLGKIEYVEELSDTERGEGGFGHTGK